MFSKSWFDMSVLGSQVSGQVLSISKIYIKMSKTIKVRIIFLVKDQKLNIVIERYIYIDLVV